MSYHFKSFMYPSNRRKFLFLSAGTAGAVFLTQCSRNTTSVPFVQQANAPLLIAKSVGTDESDDTLSGQLLQLDLAA